MENPIKMDDLEENPLFSETSKFLWCADRNLGIFGSSLAPYCVGFLLVPRSSK